MCRKLFSVFSSRAISMCAVLLCAVSAFAAGPRETVLHSFIFDSGDGFTPAGGVIQDKQGNLYGATESGGARSSGTVFELQPNRNGTWTESILYSFGYDDGDGAGPSGNLVFDKKGNLYGATSGGGAYGDGAIFKLEPASNGPWTESLLHSFHYDGMTYFDGHYPNGGLVFDEKDNLYGTTLLGGSGSTACDGVPPSGCGIVFELSPASDGTWSESILYNFQGSADGGVPDSGLTFDKAGNLYGPAEGGGSPNCTFIPADCGVIFKLSRTGNGTWTESVPYAFTGGDDGYNPLGAVVFDNAGNLYGATSAFRFEGGSVFKLTPASGGWTETTLASFQSETYGYGASGVTLDGAGNVYGITANGSGPQDGSVFVPGSFQRAGQAPPPIPFGPGTIFKISPTSDGEWELRYLYSFPANGATGSVPTGALLRGKGGAFYGATLGGGSGSESAGTVFKFVP